MSETVLELDDYPSTARRADRRFQEAFRSACEAADLPVIGLIVKPLLDRRNLRPGARVFLGDPNLSLLKARTYRKVALQAYVSTVNATAGFEMVTAKDLGRRFALNRGTIVSFNRIEIADAHDWKIA